MVSVVILRLIDVFICGVFSCLQLLIVEFCLHLDTYV